MRMGFLCTWEVHTVRQRVTLWTKEAGRQEREWGRTGREEERTRVGTPCEGTEVTGMGGCLAEAQPDALLLTHALGAADTPTAPSGSRCLGLNLGRRWGTGQRSLLSLVSFFKISC